MIKSFHHAEIIIPRGNEQDARNFYCDTLGFIEIEKPAELKKNGGLWMKIENFQIHLSVQDGYDPHSTKAHLAFTVNCFATLVDKLHQSNITLEPKTSMPGLIRGHIRDPFGNRLEFMEEIV